MEIKTGMEIKKEIDVLQDSMNNKYLDRFEYLSNMKHVAVDEEVKSLNKIVNDLSQCITGLTADSDTDNAFSTALDMIEFNIKELSGLPTEASK